MPYRLICFDAGFTLIAPQQRTEAVLGNLLARRGEVVAAAALQQAGDVARHWFWQEYHRAGNTTWGDDGQIQATWYGFYRRLLAELGLAPEPALIESAHLAYFQPDNWQIYPDVEATLERKPIRKSEA
ncbi:MAG: hypothetical protein MUD01_28370, partial [Chloroflexaceae bacterium]|nr:hypothetical protein [Chloroflexaceae bacterium]